MSPVLRYHDGAQWVEISTVGPKGPAGLPGPTGPTGSGGDEVVIGSIEPPDPAIELWVDPNDNTGGVPTAPLTGFVPIGGIMPFGGSTAPDGYHLCDGSAHGSAELEAAIGSPNTPDLKGRFIAGADGVGYTAGSTGGADSVTLTVSEMPAHAHGGASGAMSANAIHAHTGTVATTPLNHTHYYTQVTPNASVGGGAGWEFYINEATGAASAATVGYSDVSHAHTFSATASNVDHTHAITAEGGGGAHENRPPYYVLTYIIRKA